MAFGGLFTRCKSAVFWQIRAIIGRILHSNRKGGFYGLFQNAGENRERIGARIGLIFIGAWIFLIVQGYPIKRESYLISSP